MSDKWNYTLATAVLIGCLWALSEASIAAQEPSTPSSSCQECYTPKYKQAILMMNNKQYERAKQYFLDALECPDKPADSDAKEKYDRCVVILDALNSGKPIPDENGTVVATSGQEVDSGGIKVKTTQLQIGGAATAAASASASRASGQTQTYPTGAATPPPTTSASAARAAAAQAASTATPPPPPPTETNRPPVEGTTRPTQATTATQPTRTVQEIVATQETVSTPPVTSAEEELPPAQVTLPTVATIAISTEPLASEKPAAEETNVTFQGLTLGGHPSLFRRFSSYGGSETIDIDGSSGGWRMKNVPKWVVATKKETGTLHIICTTNEGPAREGVITIYDEDGNEATYSVKQVGAEGNTLSSRKWEEAFAKCCETMTNEGRVGNYKGQIGEHSGDSYLVKEGMGFFAWKDGTVYMGNYVDNAMNGLGMYLLPVGYEDTNAKGAFYVVGERANRLKSGKVNCYDRYGYLVYSGLFSEDKPVGEYPINADNESMRFEFLQFQGGSSYLGETLDGKLDGFGAYMWPEGSMWLGNWKGGIRSGKGILIHADGTIEAGHWNGDEYTKE